MRRTAFKKLLTIYQKYLTVLSFGSCRYYPTCSEYAKWQIETNPSLIRALYHSTVRILRCNQLFDGGIDYPRIACPQPPLNKLKRTVPSPKSIIYWYVPDGQQCHIIKHIFSKGPSC